MASSDDIRIIFSCLHDGTIVAWSGNRDSLTLTVECAYLAERIDKAYDKFIIEMSRIDELIFATWPNEPNLPAEIFNDLNEVFNTSLEVLSAEIEDGRVVIACNQHNPDLIYSGGNLAIRCESIRVFDEERNQLTIDRLIEICKEYWEG